MDISVRYRVRLFVDKRGKRPFQEWFDRLKDERVQAIVMNRINRLSLGNMGDCKRIGKIYELRIDHGPGYRIYFGFANQDTAILLLGGSKNSQTRDILRANRFWKEYGG